MRLLYPSNPFDRKQPDENYTSEYARALATGVDVSLFSYEDFRGGQFKPYPVLSASESICYRGWMLSLSDYQRLADSISALGATPLTTPGTTWERGKKHEADGFRRVEVDEAMSMCLMGRIGRMDSYHAAVGFRRPEVDGCLLRMGKAGG